MKPIIRNDDVSAATTAEHLDRFTRLTDKYGYKVIHAITPRGVCWTQDGWLTSRSNAEIYALGVGKRIEDNPGLLEFLRSRVGKDEFGIHGLWHTHKPSATDIQTAYYLLDDLGLTPTWFVPPFNEGNYRPNDSLQVSGIDAPNFEQTPYVNASVVQMHSWRYDPELWRSAYKGWWTWEKLDYQLQYPLMAMSKNNREKHDFLAPRITGRWLDIGCNEGKLLDRVPNGVGVDRSFRPLRPGMAQAEALRLPFKDGEFDTAVLCGVLEACKDWSEVLLEATRVARRVIGATPYPGTPYGIIGNSRWVEAVIDPSEFRHTEQINSEHYYFEVGK